jgi:hypothetical protein
MKQRLHILDEEPEYKEWERLCEEICPYCGQMFWHGQSADNKQLLDCAVSGQDGKVVAMNLKQGCDITRCACNINTQQLA